MVSKPCESEEGYKVKKQLNKRKKEGEKKIKNQYHIFVAKKSKKTTKR